MILKEIEFKYDAEDILLSKFLAFCESRNYSKFLTASGWDHFYYNPKEPSVFIRHRVGPDCNQKTIKRKLTAANNFIRTEHNIDLDMRTTKEQIAAECAEFGYEYNFSIFKTAFVFKYDWHTFVYYIVYDTELQELDRFIEIEMSEEHAWQNEQEAYGQLLVLEKTCKAIDLTPQSRVKNSLFERYKK